jgi:hypothetical protein
MHKKKRLRHRQLASKALLMMGCSSLQPPQVRDTRTQKSAHASRQYHMQGADVGRVRIYAHTPTLRAGGLHVCLWWLAPYVRILGLIDRFTIFGHHSLLTMKVQICQSM